MVEQGFIKKLTKILLSTTIPHNLETKNIHNFPTIFLNFSISYKIALKFNIKTYF